MESSKAQPNKGKAREGEMIDICKTRRRVEDVLRKSSPETVLKVAALLGVEVAKSPIRVPIETTETILDLELFVRGGKVRIRYNEHLMVGFFDIGWDKRATEQLVANLKEIDKFVKIHRDYKEGYHPFGEPPAEKWNEVTIITGFETIEELLSWLKSYTHPLPCLSISCRDYDKIPEWVTS